ncbi:hypothetical protein [Brevundimonas sp. EYE_349]|uniref:hypothetical protein n=1 Tax=Brevundimonas sp. EYE_349 TaxID=2853455 RepID=UPI002005683F|nr:hypothetical protein [Brevundimonas sp. EYE_349]MCK6105077.1 hypothetical protein [Brevundimonas sp. EYE_349]
MIAALIIGAYACAAAIDLATSIRAAEPADLGPAYVCIALSNAICWPLGIIGDMLQARVDRR